MDIAYLADHQEHIPQLAAWFYQEWSLFYPGKSVENVASAMRERTNKNNIPLALVALEGETLVGTVCLKNHDMDTRRDLSPWLAGLYVAEFYRGQGIGTALVKSIEQKAKEIGVPKVYLYTPSAQSFYLRIAWRFREGTEYHSTEVAIMEKEMTQ
jgi:GNAT superfamily N-acetyltransferase